MNILMCSFDISTFYVFLVVIGYNILQAICGEELAIIDKLIDFGSQDVGDFSYDAVLNLYKLIKVFHFYLNNE